MNIFSKPLTTSGNIIRFREAGGYQVTNAAIPKTDGLSIAMFSGVKACECKQASYRRHMSRMSVYSRAMNGFFLPFCSLQLALELPLFSAPRSGTVRN